MTRTAFYILGIAALVGARGVFGQSPNSSSEEFAKYAMRLREAAISSVEPRVNTPTTARASIYAWRNQIVTTTFWVGENSSANNPVHNRSSSWDANWAGAYGGFDNPEPSARIANVSKGEFRPAAFIPKQNPFYVALPYNDTTKGTTKPEAKKAIPWFQREFVREGQSVCKDRWVAVRNRTSGKVAYAQWSDCGPFRTDHYEYVFGTERPKPNLNGGAGLDVSPAVRDYLQINSTDVTDWRFVESNKVEQGPWLRYGDNPHFVLARDSARSARAKTSTLASDSRAEPKVRVR